ncbi:MAG: hypothetical protein A2687_00905 [Candidatus Levybacteria bacterium RIFCSPHIGHO2_01_FULL_38_26]|nr:MAG: hypothetical protein A2687_00905 [Candidatus Levybacteria bacterium RIFCSPHIGHO2_01_FULL_38_26]
MDQEKQMPPAPAPDEQIKVKKKRLFKITFIAIFILLLVGILNFFNILKIGFLPHMPYEESQQSSSDANLDPNRPATHPINNSIAEVVTLSYLPQSFDDVAITEGKAAEEDTLATWDTQYGKGTAGGSVASDGNQMAKLVIYLDYETDAPITADLAKEIVPQFFSPIPKAEFRCGILRNDLNYCESFWMEPDGTKRGSGLYEGNPFSTDPNKNSVFFCQFTKESDLYSWQSCASDFAETGIQ